MQGFNRYIPPDYNPRDNSTLNSYQGKKHALGKRAKDIDKGVLVVRFELPFNVWCDNCGSHIGAGVRYNAQKKRVGNYYSTPIYGFRCKCHLCSGWFEIRTDPQNAAYVVHEGAKRQNDEWDPVANGGFAPVDSEGPSAAGPPADAFAATEKTIDQATWAKTNTSRLTELSDLSDRQSLDPYEVSQNLRRRFRVEKQEALEKQYRDEGIRARFGLGDEVDLGAEDEGAGEREKVRGQWVAGRERRGLEVDQLLGIGAMQADADELGGNGGDSVRAVDGTPVSSRLAVKGSSMIGASGSGNTSLVQSLRKSTKRRYDPFADAADAFFTAPTPKKAAGIPRARGKIKDTAGIEASPAKVQAIPPVVATISGPAVPGRKAQVAPIAARGLGMLAGYDSD